MKTQYTPLITNASLVDWFRAGLFGIVVPVGAYYLLGGLASIGLVLVLTGMYTLLNRDKPVTYLLLIETGAILMGFLVFGLIITLGIIASGIGA